MFTAPPHPVAVPAIEQELSRLWQSAGEAQAHDAPAIMRASVSNLVAFAPTRDEAVEASQKITQLIQRHPCRAILLQVQPELGPDETRAEVALACQTAGDAQLCCEYICLSACGLDGDQLPGATLPLLLTDLPTFLWWLGDPPFGSDEFLRLSEAADRLVVDTGRFRSPLSTFTELAMEVRRERYRTAVIDLNWARLTPWRALAARLFDSREWRPYLDEIDMVSIELNNRSASIPANPIGAFLALGWLASRLGWRLDRHPVKVSDNRLTVTFHSAQREVTARLDFIPGLPHGRLRSLRLEAGRSSPRAVFHITRANDTPHAETRVVVGDGEPIVRVAQYEHRGVAELLAEEMERLGRDTAFEEALKVADAVRAMLQVEIFVPV